MTALKVADLMSLEVVTAEPGDSVAKLYDLMAEQHIRHIPILDEDEDVIGIVSHRDLVGAALGGNTELPVSELQEFLREIKAQEIMNTGVETVAPDENIDDAGALLMESKYGCLPVTENGHLVGILTESDFVRYVVEDQRTAGMRSPLLFGV